MANMKAKTGHLHDASRHLTENYNKRTQLNTYIYEYFLHNGMFQCAQSILKADSDVKQRNWPKWNVSWPQTQSSSLLLQAPGNATHNAFYNSSEMGLSKAAREKIPFPKGTIPKKRTTNVKDEMVICKIPKLNVGSTATRPANAAASPMPHINPVGIWKDAQNSSLSQAVPTGQPEVALPLTPASMAANPPVDLVQSATFRLCEFPYV
uniref:Uncharacterized protein n=1 Tax=Fusarium oxysporum (strain Fo5176) TaxID=660025 RepID=A0A0D2XSM6_FUSOF